MLDESQLDQAHNICSRSYTPDQVYVLDVEWEVIESNDMYTLSTIPSLPPGPVDGKGDHRNPHNTNTHTNNSNTNSYSNSSNAPSSSSSVGYTSTAALTTEAAEAIRDNNRRMKYDKYLREQTIFSIKTYQTLTYTDINTIKQYLAQYSALPHFQDRLNGTGE